MLFPELQLVLVNILVLLSVMEDDFDDVGFEDDDLWSCSAWTISLRASAVFRTQSCGIPCLEWVLLMRFFSNFSMAAAAAAASSPLLYSRTIYAYIYMLQ